MDTRTCSGTACVSSQWIISRVVIVTFFFVTGVIGNGTVLKVYIKEAKQASKKYIAVLAWLDLIGCTLVVPFIPSWERDLLPDQVYGGPALFHTQSYLFVQVAMVFDRIFAVYKPHNFNQLRQKTNRGLFIMFLTVHIPLQLQLLIDGGNLYLAIACVIIFSLGFATTLIAYPAIAIKLWKQSRRIKPTAASQQNQPSAATGNPNKVISESQQRTKHHIKTLKLYVAVLTLYLLAFFSTTLVAVDQVLSLNNTWVVYIYYFNSIGNPFIYYVFIEKFRDDVNLMARSIVRRLCSGIN